MKVSLIVNFEKENSINIAKTAAELLNNNDVVWSPVEIARATNDRNR